MSLFDKLKSILHIDFSKLKEINIIKYQQIHINSDNKLENVSYDDSTKTLKINLANLNQEQKEKILQALRDSMNDEGNTLLEKEANILLEDFKSKDGERDTQDKLQFLQGKVPLEDIPIWRTALYLKRCFDEKKNIEKLKIDIMCRYGDRGKKIANLCSAGYLDKLISMYRELIVTFGKEETAKEKFKIIYSTYVDEFMYTVFVSHWDKLKELKDKIEKKIIQNSRYGIKFLNLHGIGKENIEKIKEIIDIIEENYKVTKYVNEESNIILVRFIFEELPTQ